MFNIKEIFKASVCSFCENIYEYNSIDEQEFIKSLRVFLQEEDLQGCLELCTSEISYDIENIENICDNLYLLKSVLLSCSYKIYVQNITSKK